MKVLILKNYPTEGPGLISDILDDRETGYDIIELDSGGQIPSLSPYSAAFVLGGPDSANDQTEKMKSEVAAVRGIIRSGIPFFGVCLGMQVLVKAAGGQVTASPVKEVGWRADDGEYFRIHLTEPGKTDPLCSGLPESFPVFQLHGEMVEPSVSGIVLASGMSCPVQLVKEGWLAYGIQGHLELTGEMLASWLTADPDLSKKDRKKMISDYQEIKEDYESVGRRIISNFLDAVEKE